MADEPKETQATGLGPLNELEERVDEATDLAAHTPPAPTSVAEITRLLHAAVEQNIPVETMERLVALHERMSDRAAAAEFADARNRFQNACPKIEKLTEATIIPKDGRRGYQYKYAELQEVERVIRQPLHENGLSYSWDTTVEEATKQLCCVCILRHINGQRHEAKFPMLVETGTGGLSAMQKLAKAKTSARKQALIDVCGLSLGEPDTDAALGSPAPIGDDQVEVLEKLIAESGADRARFLVYLEVKSLEDIQIRQFGAAVAALEQKRKVQSHDRS